MKRARWVATTLAVVSIVGVVVALPAVSQQPPQRTTLTFFDPNRTDWEKVIDEGKKGIGPGDTILFVDAQFDPETCERVGSLVGGITISRRIGRDNAWFLGDFTLKLADGKITASAAAKFGEFMQSENGVFAVTGGTDAYRDASGEVKFLEENAERCDRRGTIFEVDIGPQP